MARCLQPHSCLAATPSPRSPSQQAGFIFHKNVRWKKREKKSVNWRFNERPFDCKSNKATLVNWMNNRKQSERCVTDFYIRLQWSCLLSKSRTHKLSLHRDVPPPPLLWAGGGVRGRGQAEVTQVALLRFRLLGCERDPDPDQTRPVGITWQLSKLLTAHLPTGLEKRKN